MKAAIFVIVTALCFATYSSAADTAPHETTNNVFRVTLTDGSVLFCDPKLEKIAIETSYATMEVPLNVVTVISNNVAKGDSIIVMKNGDLVRGKCGVTEINLVTILGELTIPMNCIVQLNSTAKTKRSFKDSPARRNACINHLRMIDAGKEQWALANKQREGDKPDIRGVNEYIKGNATPICAAGGEYTYNVVGVDPTCDCPGHGLHVRVERRK
jgi:hypothetical protein